MAQEGGLSWASSGSRCTTSMTRRWQQPRRPRKLPSQDAPWRTRTQSSSPSCPSESLNHVFLVQREAESSQENQGPTSTQCMQHRRIRVPAGDEVTQNRWSRVPSGVEEMQNRRGSCHALSGCIVGETWSHLASSGCSIGSLGSHHTF